MLAKILCISDMHKRYKDSSSIKGLMKVQQLLQEEIIKYINENGITKVILLGDWYDCGFHGLGRAYGAMEMDRRLSEAVNGEVYLCVGNHFYLERDENPEMYVIQPNAFIRPSIDIPVPEKPIFKMVQDLQIGNVQIDFFHFNKINKDYVAYRRPETTYHIGIYHDDVAVPTWVREQEGFAGTTAQSTLRKIYQNIDLGIHGHIHSKIGTTEVVVDESGRKVPLIIPGAMSPTQNKDNLKHASVDLPVITIHDDSSVELSYAPFMTHIDMLRFSDKKKTGKKPLLRDTGIVSGEYTNMVESNASLQSLPLFLQNKGYSNRQLRIIDAAATNTLNVGTAVRILSCVEEELV